MRSTRAAQVRRSRRRVRRPPAAPRASPGCSAALQRLQLLFHRTQVAARSGAERDAPAERAAHAAHHVQVVGRAVAGEAGAVALPLGHLGQLRAHQVRQCQVLEEDLHELFAAQAEDEVVLAFALVAGLAAAAALPAAALGSLDAVAAHELLVARVHDLAHAALAVAEHGFGEVLLRDVDVLAALDVADAAAVDRPLHRLADLLLVAAQESLAIADRLVLACEPPVDDCLHLRLGVYRSSFPPWNRLRRATGGRPPWGVASASELGGSITNSCARAGTTRTAGAPACWCSPCRPCG